MNAARLQGIFHRTMTLHIAVGALVSRHGLHHGRHLIEPPGRMTAWEHPEWMTGHHDPTSGGTRDLLIAGEKVPLC
jgi:hypothetical protein